jgi:hypothetical protein
LAALPTSIFCFFTGGYLVWPGTIHARSIDPAGHFTDALSILIDRSARSKWCAIQERSVVMITCSLAKLENRFLSVRAWLLSPSILSTFGEASRRGAGRSAHLCLVNTVSMPDGDVFTNEFR